MQTHVEHHPFRDEPTLQVDPDKVQIGRQEYAQLLRDAEILDRVEEGIDVFYRDGRRRPWEVTALGDWCEYGRIHDGEGVGHTFREAAEDAFGLPEVAPWRPPLPARRPWKRYVLLGALLTLGFQWVLTLQVPV